MSLVVEWLIRLLEFLFVAGCCGSIVVILLSGIEDIETIFQRGDDAGAHAVPVEKQG